MEGLNTSEGKADNGCNRDKDSRTSSVSRYGIEGD